MDEPKLGEIINQGGFGKIHYIDENIVVKKCSKSSFGISNLMEICIMNSLNHDNINSCKDFLCTERYIFLYQDKAISDLNQYIMNFKVGKIQIKKWAYQICKGVNFLHQNQIIHADIKTDNFLIFEDLSIRITDFTFSVKIWEQKYKYDRDACTITHRPIEALLKSNWDKSLDIWSLGCALFEIYYGILLFPQQENNSDIIMASINCILDWGFDGPNKESVEFPYYSVYYKKPCIPESFYDEDNALFNDMIKNMLYVDPDKRINISQVLDHPYFDEIREKEPIVINTDYEKKTFGLHLFKVARLFSVKTENLPNGEHIKSLSIKIYKKVFKELDIEEKELIDSCIYISSKIINSMVPSFIEDYNNFIITESKICNLTKCKFL